MRAILPGCDAIREEFSMQGTIRSFDPKTRSGSLLDDSLREHRYDREAFVASGLQEFRIGQRVRFELQEDNDGESRVAMLNIVSL